MKQLFLFLAFALFLCTTARSQSFESAGDYMEYIGKANQSLTEKYLFYLSGMSHGKSARKVEKRRQELLTAISNTRFQVMGMPPYKGDRTFRDSTVAYLKILNSVFNEDYGKIVNMEEIAEQSYDLMEAYMLAQEKAAEKLQEASETQHETQKKFAAKNNITLVEQQSATDLKMKTAGAVLKHYNEVYLVFFKCHKQEAYWLEAINQKKVSSIEQNINSLESFADEGLEKLKSMKGYSNDGSLIIACRNMLNFYKEEAKKAAAMTDFFLKEENFLKLKKQLDAKPAAKRTQEEIDQFNKAVKDLNATGDSYNKINADLNKQRTNGLNAWNNAVKKYMDFYMPTQHR